MSDGLMNATVPDTAMQLEPRIKENKPKALLQSYLPGTGL